MHDSIEESTRDSIARVRSCIECANQGARVASVRCDIERECARRLHLRCESPARLRAGVIETEGSGMSSRWTLRSDAIAPRLTGDQLRDDASCSPRDGAAGIADRTRRDAMRHRGKAMRRGGKTIGMNGGATRRAGNATGQPGERCDRPAWRPGGREHDATGRGCDRIAEGRDAIDRGGARIEEERDAIGQGFDAIAAQPARLSASSTGMYREQRCRASAGQGPVAPSSDPREHPVSAMGNTAPGFRSGQGPSRSGRSSLLRSEPANCAVSSSPPTDARPRDPIPDPSPRAAVLAARAGGIGVRRRRPRGVAVWLSRSAPESPCPSGERPEQ